MVFMISNIYSEITETETESQSYISISRHTLTADIADAAELRGKFVLFAKFGDKSADGATIKLTQGLSSDWKYLFMLIPIILICFISRTRKCSKFLPTHLSLQSDKWFKQAGVIGPGKGAMSTTDTGIAFKKVSKLVIFFTSFTQWRSFIFRNAPRLSFADWNRYLDEIATNKKVDVNTMKTRLVGCGEPGFTGETVS